MAAAAGGGFGGDGAGGGGGGGYRKSIYPDNSVEQSKAEQFLSGFVGNLEDAEKPYMAQLQAIANLESTTLTIYMDDIKQSFEHDPFRLNMYHNTNRYITLFYNAADRLMPQPSRELSNDDFHDAHSMYQHARQTRIDEAIAAARANGMSAELARDMYPAELTRRYQILIQPEGTVKPAQLRAIKAKDVGSFVTVRGIVTRVTDVAPQIRVASYLCSTCGYESYQTINNKDYTPLQTCPSPTCTKNEVKGKLLQQVRGSKFVRYQSVRLQELHTEVPVGHIPRTTTLRVYGSLTRVMRPGDLVTVSGIFLVAPYHGFRAVRAGLTTDTYIEAMHVVPSKKSYALAAAEQDQKTQEEIDERAQEPGIYQHLAASIAPEIYGHTAIKKALMLLLVGGVTRKLSDGMKIRGDINILLMGDPGVAKSQLLKHIAHIAPRGIYTTGKGSSGVGLTAAVLRDPTTGDMSLEGGSLVLADMGICCIDEFDKMEEGDRTAIHEVMEQQTVSIAKAGITTTLNARAAVLAAANPVWGRWRPKMTPEENLGLPASLLSRFDLTWIILDKADADADAALARHVTHVHMHSAHPQLEGVHEPFDPAFLRAYIAKARTFQPYVPKELTEYIVQSYVTLRKDGDKEADGGNSYGSGGYYSNANTRQSFCTARMLLSILRLSQALARLHFRSNVEREDVEEAMSLVNASKQSHIPDDERSSLRQDPISQIYELIMALARTQQKSKIKRSEALQRVIRAGLKETDFETTLKQYEELGTWSVSGSNIQMITQDWQQADVDE